MNNIKYKEITAPRHRCATVACHAIFEIEEDSE